MRQVLDASALLAYLKGEKGAEIVVAAFERAISEEDRILISSVNWGEVLYVLEREKGAAVLVEIIRILDNLPIDIVPVDRTDSEEAARHKAAGRLGYMDCFAAVLAEAADAELLTADKDFEAVKDQIRIVWL